MAGVNQLLKQAQKMQAKMQEAQADLATKSFTASVAGGAVQATVNGQGQLTNLKLEEGFLKDTPAELVASMTVTAVAQAQAAATKASEEIMGAMAGPLKGFLG